MSEGETEKKEAPPKGKMLDKIVVILAALAVVFGLANTVLIVLNPTAKKVEQASEELKTNVAESINGMHKKIDGLRLAEQEWQSVLKKAKEKPDAIYKIVIGQDGYLTLTEIETMAPSTAAR